MLTCALSFPVHLSLPGGKHAALRCAARTGRGDIAPRCGNQKFLMMHAMMHQQNHNNNRRRPCVDFGRMLCCFFFAVRLVFAFNFVVLRGSRCRRRMRGKLGSRAHILYHFQQDVFLGRNRAYLNALRQYENRHVFLGWLPQCREISIRSIKKRRR